MSTKYVRPKFVTALLLGLSLLASSLVVLRILMPGEAEKQISAAFRSGSVPLSELYARIAQDRASMFWLGYDTQCVFAILTLLVLFAGWRVWQSFEIRKDV